MRRLAFGTLDSHIHRRACTSFPFRPFPFSATLLLMSQLSEILSFNREFVSTKAYESFLTDRYPDKKIVIVTCMDTRLTELLPKAMNLRNGDAKFIKIAGAVVAAPFGSVMRSILVFAIYSLGAEEIYVVGHHDCGITGMGHEVILKQARDVRGLMRPRSMIPYSTQGLTWNRG